MCFFLKSKIQKPIKELALLDLNVMCSAELGEGLSDGLETKFQNPSFCSFVLFFQYPKCTHKKKVFDNDRKT